MARRRVATGRDEALRPRLRSLLSSLGLAAVAGLVVLHLSLFWDRVTQGRLGEPAIALRWLAAVGLMAALLALRRRGVPLLWGRRALVFWLLVLLLHAGTAVPQESGPRLAPQLLFVVPAAVGPAGILFVLLLALVRALAGPAVSLALVPASSAPALRGGFLPALASRPPPA